MYSPKIHEAPIPPLYRALGVLQKHDAIVFGALGYGVFGNDTNEMLVSFNAAYTILSALTVGRYLRLSIGQRKNVLSVHSNDSFQRRHDEEQITHAKRMNESI